MKLPDPLAVGRTFAKLTPKPAGLRPATPAPDLRTSGNSGAPPGAAAVAFSRLAIPTPGSATWPNEPDLLRPLRPAVPSAATTSTPTAPAAPFSTTSPAPVSPARRRRWWWRKRGRGPRQGELGLAAVRVVRNDLFADDLEFIPRPSPQARGLTLGAERAVPSGGWRGWLAHWANLLGLRRERRP